MYLSFHNTYFPTRSAPSSAPTSDPPTSHTSLTPRPPQQAFNGIPLGWCRGAKGGFGGFGGVEGVCGVGPEYLRFQTVSRRVVWEGGRGGGGAAGSCCVLKHCGAPLYEWNQVRHRSPLLVQLSRGPGADGGPV